MIKGSAKASRPLGSAQGVQAHTTLGFAALCDHARLPARFFARLFASGGSLLRR